MPLQVSGDDNCFLHVELARLLYCHHQALRELQELQIFLSFFLDMNQLNIHDEGTTPARWDWKPDGEEIKETIIIKRAMCNLIRLGLLDQHHLELPPERLPDPRCIEIPYFERYKVSLTRSSSKQVGT